MAENDKDFQNISENIKFPRIINIYPKKTLIGSGFNFQSNKQSALEVKGRFFTTSSIIYFGETPLHTTFGSEKYITGLVPKELLDKVSSSDIYVINNNKYRSNSIPFIIHDRGFRYSLQDLSAKIFHEISYRMRYLYRRNIIKNTTLNLQEMDQKKTILKSTPRFMIIDPTNKCNCRCTICYRVYKKLEDSELSIDIFNKLASYLKNAKDVNLMGTGESFLNKNFIEMARLCKKNGAVTFLSSNGMLINNNLEVLKYIDNLNISFDGGTKETFEKIRVGAKFEKVIENIKIVQSLKHKPIVRLDVRVSKQNLEELPKIVKIAKDLKINEVSFMPVCPQGKWLDKIILTEDDGLKFNMIKEEVLNLGDALGVKCIIGFSLGDNSEVVKQIEIEKIDNIKSIEKQKSNKVYCTAPFRMIYVEYSGKIRPCCLLNKYMGDLNENSIEEIWNNQEYQSLRVSMIGRAELDEFCKKCTDGQRFI